VDLSKEQVKIMNTGRQRHSVIMQIVNNAYIQLCIGLLLLFTILFDGLFFDIQHSMSLLALWHIAQALPGILQALERIDRIEENNKDVK